MMITADKVLKGFGKADVAFSDSPVSSKTNLIRHGMVGGLIGSTGL